MDIAPILRADQTPTEKIILNNFQIRLLNLTPKINIKTGTLKKMDIERNKYLSKKGVINSAKSLSDSLRPGTALYDFYQKWSGHSLLRKEQIISLWLAQPKNSSGGWLS